MAQQLLHRPQIGARVQHVGGEGVPERVHPESVAADRVEHAVDGPLDAARREPPARGGSRTPPAGRRRAGPTTASRRLR